jgi:hypothetical protein
MSPLGEALVGRSRGDRVVVKTPGGSSSFQILDFEPTLDFDMLKSHRERWSLLALRRFAQGFREANVASSATSREARLPSDEEPLRVSHYID